jgi:4'-phosphopantetheinyl transferase EntD
MSEINDADEPVIEQPLAPLWSDEVYRFIEHCRDTAAQEERNSQ